MGGRPVGAQALTQNNHDGARIHAQNAIRKKNEAINYLRLSSRVDAVASKVQTAVSLKQVTKNISGVVSQMDKAMNSMNLEQVRGELPLPRPVRARRTHRGTNPDATARAAVLREMRAQVSMVMDKFEKQFEDLDVQTQTMENSMASSSVMTTPSEQVDQLIQEVAEQSGTSKRAQC